MKNEDHDMWNILFDGCEAPESRKNEVFDSLASLRLRGNGTDLFSEKMLLTQSNFSDEDEQDKPDEKGAIIPLGKRQVPSC